VIYSTQNDTCSTNEKEKAKAYGIMAEYLISKNARSNPTEVSAYCMKLDEITVRTFPYVMKQIETQMPDLLIYVGGLEANLDAYDDQSSVWWRSCNKTTDGKCIPHQIVVCDECKRWGVHMPDFEDVIDNGMWHMNTPSLTFITNNYLVWNTFSISSLVTTTPPNGTLIIICIQVCLKTSYIN
jgi:hypothetical protein